MLRRDGISLADDVTLAEAAEGTGHTGGGGGGRGMKGRGGNGHISIESEVLRSFLIDCLNIITFSQNALPSQILHITRERACAWFSVSSFEHLGHQSLESAFLSLCGIDVLGEQTSMHAALRASHSLLPLSLGCISSSHSDQVNPNVYRSTAGAGEGKDGTVLTDPVLVSKAIQAIVHAPLLCSDLSLSLCWRERFYTSLGPLSSFISQELYDIRLKLKEAGRMLIQTAPLRFSLLLTPGDGKQEGALNFSSRRILNTQESNCTQPEQIQYSARQCAAFLAGLFVKNSGFERAALEPIHSRLKEYFSLLAEDAHITSFTLSLSSSLSPLPTDIFRSIMESIVFPNVSIVIKDVASTFLSCVLSEPVSWEHVPTMNRLAFVCGIPLWNDVVQKAERANGAAGGYLDNVEMEHQLSNSTFSSSNIVDGKVVDMSVPIDRERDSAGSAHQMKTKDGENGGVKQGKHTTPHSSSSTPNESSSLSSGPSPSSLITSTTREEAGSVIQSIREAHGMDLDESQMDENTLKMRQNNHNTIGRALEKLSTELYSKDTHFVLELIQNADDNEYNMHTTPTLVFSVLPDRIVLRNNEVGFSAKNVTAICDVARSTKSKHSLGFIGAKGIGFKSVYCVTDTPFICSGHYRFKFDRKSHSLGYILPHTVTDLEMVDALGLSLPPFSSAVCTTEREATEVLERESEKWRTMMSLPFSDQQVTKLLKQVNPFLLLFLHRLQRIDLNDANTNKSVTMMKERIGENIVQVSHTERELASSTSLSPCPSPSSSLSPSASASLSPSPSPSLSNHPSSRTHTMWCMLESHQIDCINILRSGEKVERTEVTVGFPLPPSSLLYQITTSHQTDILPTQEVFAFLPVRSYGFKFIVQGDFVVPSSRESVSDCEWNEMLRSFVPKLFCEGVKQFIEPSEPLLAYICSSIPELEEEDKEREEEEEEEEEEESEKRNAPGKIADLCAEYDVEVFVEDEVDEKEREAERVERENEKRIREREREETRKRKIKLAAPSLCQLYLEYIPSLSHTNDFFASSASDIHNRLKKTKCILSRSRSWNLPGDVIQVPHHLHEAVVSLLPYQSEHLLFHKQFIHPDVRLSPSLSHALDINSFGAEHVIAMAKEVVSSSLRSLNMKSGESRVEVEANTEKKASGGVKGKKMMKKKKKKEKVKKEESSVPAPSTTLKHLILRVEELEVPSFSVSSSSPSTSTSISTSLSLSLSLKEKKERVYDWLTKWFLLLSDFWRLSSGANGTGRNRQSQIPQTMIERVRQLRLIPLRSGQLVSMAEMRSPIFLRSPKEGEMNERERHALELLENDVHLVCEKWLGRIKRENEKNYKNILQVLAIFDIRPLSLSDIATKHILSHYLAVKREGEGECDASLMNRYFSFLFLTCSVWEKKSSVMEQLRDCMIVPTVCCSVCLISLSLSLSFFLCFCLYFVCPLCVSPSIYLPLFLSSYVSLPLSLCVSPRLPLTPFLLSSSTYRTRGT